MNRLLFRRPARKPPLFATGGIGRMTFDPNQEVLSGSIQGLKASAPEERFGRSLQKDPRVTQFFFRMALGADRNMPGFKELDYLVESKGLFYAFELDTPFTHRAKQNADVFHDAFVLQALETYNVFPHVFHIDGETELATQQLSDRTEKGFF